MKTLILRKVSLLLAGWLCASLLIFFTLRLLPGDVAQVIAGTTATPATVARLRAELGLNTPLLQQYGDWIIALLQGNLGTSLLTNTPIATLLAEKAQVTVPLLLLSMVFTLLLAVPLGVWLGLHSTARLPRFITSLVYSTAAAPPVWVALLLITVFATWLGLLPAVAFPATGWAKPAAALHALLLPALTIAVIEAAVLVRFVRSATLTALAAPPVRTGMSFGLTKRAALVQHALPAASLSLLGTVAVQTAGLLVGAVLIEKLFVLPGIGSLLVSATGNRDLTTVASVLLVLTGFVLLRGFLVDLLQAAIDPRLRQTGGK